jgi:hypothetical protein
MRNISRSLGLVLTLAMAAPHVGCNNSRHDQPPPPVDDTQGGTLARQAPTPDRPHMTTRNKVVVLAGAAALYYLYKHHQHAAAAAQTGVDSQYYLSKNGRVYYRDAEHRAHWVTPPPGGIQVPASEAGEYSQFQGYDNQPNGRDLTGLATDEAQ